MKALNIDIAIDSSATTAEPVRFVRAPEDEVPFHGRHNTGSNRRHVALWYERNALTGVVEGVILSAISTTALVLTCLVVDEVLKKIGLLTMSVSWIWWTVVTLNALTVLIPIDVFRLRKHQSNHSAHDRASVITYGALELIVVTLFLVMLYGFQGTDIQFLQSLGLL